MKQSLFAGVSLSALALVSGAQAADLGARPVYKAATVAPAWSWTGFYIGAHVGAGRARGSIADSPVAGAYIGNVPDSSRTSLIGGVQAGYNWQFSNLVLGVEGDISFGSLTRTTTGIGFATPSGTYESRLSTFGTLRGRLGFAVDRVLFYGTGGAALANLKDSYTDGIITPAVSTQTTAWGWAAGGGVEYAFAQNWTVRAEYLHLGFQNRTVNTNVLGTAYGFAFKDRVDIGRVGLNYKF